VRCPKVFKREPGAKGQIAISRELRDCWSERVAFDDGEALQQGEWQASCTMAGCRRSPTAISWWSVPTTEEVPAMKYRSAFTKLSRALLITGLLIAPTLVTRKAAADYPAPACYKTMNQLTQCQVTPVLANGGLCQDNQNQHYCTLEEEEDGSCVGNNMVPRESLVAYNEARYRPPTGPGGSTDANTAFQMLESCKTMAALKKADGQAAYAAYYPGGPITVRIVDWEYGVCRVDRNGDNDANDQVDEVDHVQRVYLTPEPHCNLIPDGPYADEVDDNPSPPQYDALFHPDLLPDLIEVQNAHATRYSGQRVTAIWSDGGWWRDSTWKNLFTNPSRPNGLDYFSTLTTTNFVPKQKVQMHHIIPRKDAQGCNCGTNSAANVVLVSAQLNGEMSNKLTNRALMELLAKYTQTP
jgi:hypothetical protein